MNIDPGDSGRLRRIEQQLVEADSSFANAFRRWREPPGDDALSRHSTVRPWMLAVFLTAFTSWFTAPVLGFVACALAAAWLGWTSWQDRVRIAGGRKTEGAARYGRAFPDGKPHRSDPDDGWMPPPTCRGGWI